MSHILVTNLFLHYKDSSLHDGRDFIFFCSLLYMSTAQNNVCPSGHATNIWGMLMQMTNESPMFPSVYSQSIQVSPHLTWKAPSWKLVWAIQSNGDSHILHMVSYCTITPSAFCVTSSFGPSGASHLLKYLLLLAKGTVWVKLFKLFWLPLPGLSQKYCSWNHGQVSLFADLLGFFFLPSPSSLLPPSSRLSLLPRPNSHFFDSDVWKQTKTLSKKLFLEGHAPGF